MPNKRGYKKRGSALKTSPPATSPRRIKTPTPTQTLTPVRRVGRPPSKLRTPASPIQRSPLPTVSPKLNEKLQQPCNHTQQSWPDVCCGTTTTEVAKPREMHDSPEHSTSLHDSSDQETNIQDHLYRPQSQHSVSEDDAMHANPATTAAMPPDSHPPEDTNNSQNRPKKLSKREVKALLKQPKRARTILDESVVAEMDQLATRFEVDCKINIAGVIQRSIPVAEPINSTPLLSAPSVPVPPPAPSVVRGGRGRGRGRRGSAAAASLRRGGGKAGSFSSLAPAPTRTPRTASWSPLCLPARVPSEGLQQKSPAPRLKYLSASCVKNFLARMESILSRSHSQQSRLLSTPSLDANGFDFSHKQEPSAPLTTYPPLSTNPTAAPTPEQSYYQHQHLKHASHHHHHQHHHEMPEDQHHIRKAEPFVSNYAPHSTPPAPPPPPQSTAPTPPESLQVSETTAISMVRHVRLGRPPKRGGQRRGRGRPRILNLSSDDSLRAAVGEVGSESERAKWHQDQDVDQPRSYHPGSDDWDGPDPLRRPPSPATDTIPPDGPGVPAGLTAQQVAKPGKPGRPRGSNSARRELRGLVTWAAMMAAEEQAAQQKQHRRRSTEDADSSFNSEPTRKHSGLSPLSLQIVGMEDDLTVTADGGGLSDPSRTTRRTRRASLGTASGGSSVGATTVTRGGHASGRRASETGSSVSAADGGDRSLRDGLQPNVTSWAADQAETSSLLPFTPSPLRVASSDAAIDSTVPELQQNNPSSNDEVELVTNMTYDQLQLPARSSHRGRGGGARGRKRKYQRGLGRSSEQVTPHLLSQSDASGLAVFSSFATANGSSSEDNNLDKCVSDSPLRSSTAAEDEGSPSSGSRRLDPTTAGGGSGTPILPPRKRYKANVDSTDEEHPSTSPPPQQQPTSRPPVSSPSIDGGDLSPPSSSNPTHPNLSDLSGGYLAPVGSAANRSYLESESPFGVRGGTRGGRAGIRGRRKGRGGRRSLHQPFETHQDAKAAAAAVDNTAASVDTTPSRPKREAAALGFASLVASSLNSSPIQYDQSESTMKPSQQASADHLHPHYQHTPSSLTTSSETADSATAPTTPVGVTASVRTPPQKPWRGGGTPPVGRGRGLRGRPPKRPLAATPIVLFPPPFLAAAAAAADGTLQAKLDSSVSSDTSVTTVASATFSPPTESTTAPTISAITEAPTESTPSEAEVSAAGPLPPAPMEANLVLDQESPALAAGKRKIGGGGKRGRRPTTTQISSPPTKRRALEDTTSLLSSSVNGSSATAPTTKAPPPPLPVSPSGPCINELERACRDLRLFLLRTHARSEHRLRRDRERRLKAAAKVVTARVDDTVGSTKRLLTGTIERLPSRNLIFPLDALSRKLLDESEEGRTDLKGDLMPPDGVQTALATLLYRLLNHPDLEQNDTKARLVAPLISTPDPLRHPDFYRYACSTGALASLEAALGLPLGHSLQADILLTVSPCYCLTNGYAGQRSVPAPFQHLCPEYPPICLRSLLHSVLSGKLMSTAEGDSASSPLTPATAFQRLDLAFDLLMRLWESFAGRRSWLGRRLLQIRTAYTRLRTEQAAEDSSIPLPNLTPGSAFGTTKVQGASPVSGPPKKKVDRKTLERGAEVIRCLCGFRVEAGHVMVQCDCCTTWQHLPCVWWALSLCLEPSLAAPRSTPSSQLPNWLPHRPPLDPDCEADEDTAADPAARRARCRAALLAALLTGRISLPAHSGGGGGGSAGSTAVSDCAYFCPICLELDGLTKDYPRTLAVALAQNDVTKVFPETTSEATTGVTYEYWSLASPDGGDQLLTDEFALVHRDDFRHAVERGSVVAATASVIEQKDSTHELRLASDVVVLRIYRLWKDSSGNSWMEGGAFLRPYDLLDGAHPQTTALVNSQLWHARELVYDEASRVVLPLSAWRGRCSVLSPTVYRQGRLMDLPALILPSSPVDNSSKEVEETDAHPLVFLCDRLFNRGEGDSLSFQEIAPAYLKVNMKPYAFLRHTESSTLRAAIVRQLRAEDLRTLDSTTAFGAVLSVNLDGLYSQSRERRQKGRQAPLSPLRTKELVFSLSEKRTLTTALKRLSSLPRKQLTVITENRVFTHTSRRPCSPVKLKCPPICHPNSCVGTSEALSSSVKPTSEQCSTQIPLATQEADMATSTAFPPTHPAVVVPSTKRSGKSKVGASKIREQDILKEAKTLTFIELQEKIAAQEGLSAKTASPHPRRKAVGKQHNNISTTTVKSAFKHATAVASASVPTESTQSNISSPLFVETAPPPAAATATEMAKKPQFSPISPATSPFSPDPISSAVAVVSDIVQQQQQRRLPASHESVSPASQSPQELPSTESLPLGARLLSPTEAITLDKPLEESVSEFSEDEPSSSATSGSVVVATAVETACHNAACSEVMLATSSPLNPIPLKVNQALVMTSSEEADFETCDERFSLPEPQLVAIQEEGNDDLAEDGDVQHACTHLSAGVMVSTAGSVSVVTCMPVVSHMAEASRIPCSVMTLEISPPLETLEGLDVMEVNEEFPQRTVCPHSNAFSTVCEMVLNSPFSTTDVALRSLSDIPSPSEVTSLVVTSPSDFVARTSSTVVYTCPLASSLAPGRCVSSPDRHQHRSPPPLISPAFSYQPISPDSSDESPCSAHATAQPLQIEAPNAVSDGTAHLEDNRLLTAGTEEEKRRQRHSTSRSSPSAAWSPTQCRDHKDRRRHSHHRSHHHFRDRDHHCRSSSNRSRSNSEHQQSLEHHQHRHYHRHQHHHSDCSSVESEHREHRERQRSRSQSDHRHSRHERCPEAKDATVSSIAAAENASRPNSHHRRRKGHSPKRIVFRRYEDGTGATSTRGSVVPTQEGVLDLSTSSSSTLAPESNGGGGGGEVSSGGSSNN